MDASQEDVFDAVAKEAVDSTLDGYNATIFAYGQTGACGARSAVASNTAKMGAVLPPFLRGSC